MPDTLASSTITQHVFTAEPWWDTCAICGLGEAAHRLVAAATFASMMRELNELTYRCPACVWASEFHKPAPHKGECPHAEPPSRP